MINDCFADTDRFIKIRAGNYTVGVDENTIESAYNGISSGEIKKEYLYSSFPVQEISLDQYFISKKTEDTKIPKRSHRLSFVQGPMSLRRILNDKQFMKVPMIVEPQKNSSNVEEAQALAQLRALAGESAAE